MPSIELEFTCVVCRGSLRGVELVGVCPRCRAPVDYSLAVSVIDPEAMAVAQSVLCVHCGYDLRTLAVAAACPECGHDVHDSLRPDDWVGYVLRGVNNLLVAGVCLLLMVPVSRVGVVSTGVAIVASVVVGLPALVMLIVGIERISKPEHYAGRMPRPPLRRRLAVWCGVLAAGLFVASFALGVYGRASGVIATAAILSGFLCLIAASECLRRVALRFDRFPLARLTVLLAAALAVTGLVAAALPVLAVFYGGAFVPVLRVGVLLACISYLLGMLTLIQFRAFLKSIVASSTKSGGTD